MTLHVDAGEVVTLVGSNGAGKTNFLRTVSGLHRGRSSRGRVTFDGQGITGHAGRSTRRTGMALVPERRQVWPEHTVVDNLRLGAFSLRRDRSFVTDRLAYCYSLFPALEQRRRQQAGTLSGGEQRMLAVARALMAEVS